MQMLTHARLNYVRLLAVAGVVLLCCAAPRANAAADAVDLRLRPVKGQAQKIQATVSQKITQTINGSEQSLTQTIGLNYTFTTEDVAADGTATIKVSYDAVSFKQVSQLGNVE